MEPQRSIRRFDEASLGRDAPKTNPSGERRKNEKHRPNAQVSLDNADAVIDALPCSLQTVLPARHDRL